MNRLIVILTAILTVMLAACQIAPGARPDGAAAPRADIVLLGVVEHTPQAPVTLNTTNDPAALRNVFVRDAAGTAQSIQSGMDLQPGDTVEATGRFGVVIQFPEEHVVYVPPGSRVKIGSIFLETLATINEVYILAKGLFRVETRDQTIGVKGTELWVQVTPQNVVTTHVWKGSVEQISKLDTSRRITVTGGQTVRAQGTALAMQTAAPTGTVRTTLTSLQTVTPQLYSKVLNGPTILARPPVQVTGKPPAQNTRGSAVRLPGTVKNTGVTTTRPWGTTVKPVPRTPVK